MLHRLAAALGPARSVVGERRCLACGRAFRDLPRFAQHIKDAHGGVNASGASPIPASTSGRGAYGGGAPRPGPRAAVQLRDVLLGSMPPPMTGPQASSKQQLHRQARHAQQARQAAQHPGTAGGRAAPVALAASTHVSRAAAASFAPPPGTRQRKQNKRESRLKRAFRRSQAMLACERWQGVLAGGRSARGVHSPTLGSSEFVRPKACPPSQAVQCPSCTCWPHPVCFKRRSWQSPSLVPCPGRAGGGAARGGRGAGLLGQPAGLGGAAAGGCGLAAQHGHRLGIAAGSAAAAGGAPAGACQPRRHESTS